MNDLLVITPSRGRPDRLREMIDACRSLSAGAADIAVAIDYDDPEREAYESYLIPMRQAGEICLYTGSRHTLTGWTNILAREHSAEWPGRDPLLPAPMHPSYRAFASFGDDHVPETPGWDSLLLAALNRMGGTGIAYGDDKLMGGNLCTAPVVSSDIVAALGHLFEPSFEHMCVDVALMDIGRGAGCLAYVPEVITRHVHWCNNGAPMDATYAAAEAVKEADRARYDIWREERMAGDIAKVRALIERKADAAV